MSTSLEFCHEFPFASDRYLDIFFDRTFVDHLGHCLDHVDDYRLQILERTSARNLRTIKVVPHIDLPRTMRTVLRGKRISWLETTSHQVGSKVLAWTILTNVLTEKTEIFGSYVLEDLGPDRCRRTVLGKVTVHAYGIGSTIEERIAQQMKDSFASGCSRMIAYAQQ